MGISSGLGSSALLPAGLGFRNKIMNGDFRINQRGTGVTAGSASKQFMTDRWVFYNGTGTVNFQQSTVAPAGFTNSLQVTNSATPASYGTNGYTEFGQFIEGFNTSDLAWGTASAKPIVISFWVQSSITGVYNIAIQNNAQNRSYIASFTVNTANTWEYKTVFINGDTTGTWLTDNNVGLRVWFNLGMGTAYDTTGNTWVAGNLGSTSNAVDFAATANATFYITGVQLEQNYQPTPFEQRPYGVELQLCQRYYEKTYDYATAPATNTNLGFVGVGGPDGVATTYFFSSWRYKTEKRATPTVTLYDITGNSGKITTWQSGSTTSNVTPSNGNWVNGTNAHSVLHQGSVSGWYYQAVSSAEL